jgi:hypothetical protein
LSLAHAVINLFAQSDPSGRVPGDIARQLVGTISGAPAAERSALMREPGRYLGRFDELPPAARQGILRAIADSDAARLAGREPDGWYLGILRSLFRLRARMNARKRDSRSGSVAQQLADAVAFGARRAPSELSQLLDGLKGRVSARLGRSSRLAALIGAAGLDVRPLAVCYARPIPQPESYRGYWHDPGAMQSVGVVAGVDFLPTDEGYRYVECNINFAQRSERSAMYETDPYVENLLDFAIGKGYRRFVLVDSATNGIDPVTAQRLESGASARNLVLTIVDRENVPESKYLRRYGLPPIDTRETLVVRTRSYPTALDYVADMKRASVLALQRYQASCDEPDLLLPESGPEPVLGSVGSDEPFPNTVYKLPELDQARGVFFLKADSAGHARSILGEAMRSSAGASLLARLDRLAHGGDGIWQAFYKSRMVSGRRLYKVRAHVLITPVGVRFLSAHRVIASKPLPDTLPSGVISDPSPFLVNYSAGSWYEVVPDDEEPAVARAAEAVGRGIAWAFEYGFLVGSRQG